MAKNTFRQKRGGEETEPNEKAKSGEKNEGEKNARRGSI